MKVAVILPAAGLGTRMGKGTAVQAGTSRKQFMLLEGSPILLHTVRKFAASVREAAGNPIETLMTRFSTCPSSPTKMTSARSGSSRTNSMCFSRTFDFAVSTTPAARVRSDSMTEASLSTASMDLPAAATLASISRRSDSARSPISITASTKKRKPSSVGSRPADVCGA